MAKLVDNGTQRSYDNSPSYKGKVETTTSVNYSGSIFSSLALFILIMGCIWLFTKGIESDFHIKPILNDLAETSNKMIPINNWFNFNNVTSAIDRLNASWSGSAYVPVKDAGSFFQNVGSFFYSIISPLDILVNIIISLTMPIFYGLYDVGLMFAFVFK